MGSAALKVCLEGLEVRRLEPVRDRVRRVADGGARRGGAEKVARPTLRPNAGPRPRRAPAGAFSAHHPNRRCPARRPRSALRSRRGSGRRARRSPSRTPSRIFCVPPRAHHGKHRERARGAAASAVSRGPRAGAWCSDAVSVSFRACPEMGTRARSRRRSEVRYPAGALRRAPSPARRFSSPRAAAGAAAGAPADAAADAAAAILGMATLGGASDREGGCSRMIPRATGGSPVASARWCLRPSHSADEPLRQPPQARSKRALCAVSTCARARPRTASCAGATASRSRGYAPNARFLSSLSSSFSAVVAASRARRQRGRPSRRARGETEGPLEATGASGAAANIASAPQRIASAPPGRKSSPRSPTSASRGRASSDPAPRSPGTSSGGSGRWSIEIQGRRGRGTRREARSVRNGRCLATWWASSRAWRAVAVMKGKAGCGGQTRAR